MAGRWLFGDKAYQSGQVILVNNAIQAEKFCFQAEERDVLRKKMGWENKIVIGHVGRFDIPKNHDRMVDIMKCVVTKNKDVVLCLIGPKEGLYEQIREKVQKADLEKHVYFAGKQENVSRYLSAMDVFLFPSLFEGVPFALIEEQANGLPCVMSDAVSEEAVIFPESVKRLSLQKDDQTWADTIIQMGNLKRKPQDVICEGIRKAHFDITTEAQRLKDLYLGIGAGE